VLAHQAGVEATSHDMDQPPAFVLAQAQKDAAKGQAEAETMQRENSAIVPLGVSENVAAMSPKQMAGLWEPPAVQYVVAFTPYFNYKGTIKTQGTMSVKGTSLLKTATQTLSWELTGLDPDCKTTPEGVKNACGIHIHEGTSCYEDAGGHYWDKNLINPDPWTKVTYKTLSWFTQCYATEKGVDVVTGLTNFDVLGHTMIVHDHTGARVACGVITPYMLAVPAFTPYFDYTGYLEVTGSMAVSGPGVADSAGQTLSWELKGVDPRCKEGAGVGIKNSCGVHIHAGKNCSSDALGHYWNKTTLKDDPWSSVGYTSVSWFLSDVYAWERARPVVTGLENSLVNGHTMIVHDYDGGRIGCGIIAPHAEVANAFVPYFSYTGALKVSGWVKAVGRGVVGDASQVLAWKLKGVDPACSTAPASTANPNACGIHIHVGKDCTSNAGGHYFAVSKDPWTAVKYRTQPGDDAEAIKQTVVTGLTNYEVLGHTMIVHDSKGDRIACSILNVAGE